MLNLSKQRYTPDIYGLMAAEGGSLAALYILVKI